MAGIFEFAGLRHADAAGGCPLSEPEAVSKVKTATDPIQRASDKITKLAAFFLLIGGRRRLFISFR